MTLGLRIYQEEDYISYPRTETECFRPEQFANLWLCQCPIFNVC